MTPRVSNNAYVSAVVVLACAILAGIIVILLLVHDGGTPQVSMDAVEDQGSTLTVPAGRSPVRVRALFDAIRQVESGGDNMAVGDGGSSKGPYQISRAYWDDACEYIGDTWDYDTYVWIDPVAEHIMMAYWQRYGATTDEERARIHNGGPKGMSKLPTKVYWHKVQQIIERN